VTLTVIEVDFHGKPEHHAFKHVIFSIGEWLPCRRHEGDLIIITLVGENLQIPDSVRPTKHSVNPKSVILPSIPSTHLPTFCSSPRWVPFEHFLCSTLMECHSFYDFLGPNLIWFDLTHLLTFFTSALSEYLDTFYAWPLPSATRSALAMIFLVIRCDLIHLPTFCTSTLSEYLPNTFVPSTLTESHSLSTGYDLLGPKLIFLWSDPSSDILYLNPPLVPSKYFLPSTLTECHLFSTAYDFLGPNGIWFDLPTFCTSTLGEYLPSIFHPRPSVSATCSATGYDFLRPKLIWFDLTLAKFLPTLFFLPWPSLSTFRTFFYPWPSCSATRSKTSFALFCLTLTECHISCVSYNCLGLLTQQQSTC
jgi:hypothetical protein